MSARALRPAAFAIAWAVLGAGASNVRAQAPAAAPANSDATTTLPAIHEWKLKNGLSVAHVERPGLPMVTVQVWYRFGSKDEPNGQHGAARAFERLMFMGSERVRSDDHRRYVEQVGGESTALITEDVSAFHNALPVEQLDVALELEAERMRRLLVRSEAVESIRPAMLDELGRQESSPVYRAYQRLLSLVFSAHPYAWSPLGVRADLQKLSGAQLKALYDAYFVPSNALVVVVGGVSRDAAARAIERWFGALAAGKPPAGAAAAEPAQTEPRRQELAGSPIGVVMAGHRLPAASDADVLALQITGMVLAGGESSRLHRRLVRAKLADEIGGQVLVRRDGGVLVAFARFSSGSAAGVEKALAAEIDRMAAQGPTLAEVKRARGQILGGAWFGMESATGLANQIGVSWGLTGKPAGFLADLAELEKIGPAQVRRAAAKYLSKKQRALVVAEPGAARPAGGAQ
ncbi:MAG TPA: pitrilysin family protein [Kofleriaceae bacterium]|nr:pitrilysin family protein [Kofleriaceae bacterium]